MNQEDKFRFPGEFEKQEAVWFSWPNGEALKGLSKVPVVLELIATLVNHVHVKIGAQNELEKSEIESLLKENNIDLNKITIYIIPHNTVWARDFGPIFMVNGQGGKYVLRFAFNCWGQTKVDSPRGYLDQRFANYVAKYEGLKLEESSLISEGGDREFNGHGTLIVVESVELQRNPGMTRDQIEQKLKEIFHLNNVIWLEKGVYEDDHVFDGPLPGPDGTWDILPVTTTNGHIDEHCRFLDKNTVIVSEVTEEEAEKSLIAKENRRRMERNVAVLKKSVDQDGKKLQIKRIPMPDPIFGVTRPGDALYDLYAETYKEGFIFPLGDSVKVIAAGSYCNFLITNGAVLMPKYWKPGYPYSMKQKDDKAQSVIREFYGNERKVYSFHVMPLNFDGGGIHCITQQEPVIKKTQ